MHAQCCPFSLCVPTGRPHSRLRSRHIVPATTCTVHVGTAAPTHAAALHASSSRRTVMCHAWVAVQDPIQLRLAAVKRWRRTRWRQEPVVVVAGLWR